MEDISSKTDKLLGAVAARGGIVGCENVLLSGLFLLGPETTVSLRVEVYRAAQSHTRESLGFSTSPDSGFHDGKSVVTTIDNREPLCFSYVRIRGCACCEL